MIKIPHKTHRIFFQNKKHTLLKTLKHRIFNQKKKKTLLKTQKTENIVPKEEKNIETDNTEQEEEEEGECGFCMFMKGGGCKDSFIAWENCIQEAEEKNEDIVDKCFQVTGDLKKCMESYSEYYSLILQAEKASEKEFEKELEKEDLKVPGDDDHEKH